LILVEAVFFFSNNEHDELRFNIRCQGYKYNKVVGNKNGTLAHVIVSILFAYQRKPIGINTYMVWIAMLASQ
jgi:hypothetical protein